jgi:hypothetical protein
MVQASTLQARRCDQICDRSIMIASLSKHASRNVGYLLPTLFVAQAGLPPCWRATHPPAPTYPFFAKENSASRSSGTLCIASARFLLFAIPSPNKPTVQSKISPSMTPWLTLGTVELYRTFGTMFLRARFGQRRCSQGSASLFRWNGGKSQEMGSRKAPSLTGGRRSPFWFEETYFCRQVERPHENFVFQRMVCLDLEDLEGGRYAP